MAVFYGVLALVGLASSIALAGTVGARPTSGAEGDRRTFERGAQIYAESCVVCHLEDGRGVPKMQPPLVGSHVVSDEPATFAALLLRGAAASLPATRASYESEMPTFEALSDEELAAVMTYVRARFGNRPRPVTPAQIGVWRERK